MPYHLAVALQIAVMGSGFSSLQLRARTPLNVDVDRSARRTREQYICEVGQRLAYTIMRGSLIFQMQRNGSPLTNLQSERRMLAHCWQAIDDPTAKSTRSLSWDVVRILSILKN